MLGLLELTWASAAGPNTAVPPAPPTVIAIVLGVDGAVPSSTVNVKLSGPLKPAPGGVYVTDAESVFGLPVTQPRGPSALSVPPATVVAGAMNVRSQVSTSEPVRVMATGTPLAVPAVPAFAMGKSLTGLTVTLTVNWVDVPPALSVTV